MFNGENMNIDVDDLKKLNPRPRLHGNGFIQLEVRPKTRLHIWHPDLPRQEISTQIHNHRFAFESHVILGRQLNICWDVWRIFDEPATHVIYEATRREKGDTVLKPVKERSDCIIRARYTQLVEKGHSYLFPPWDFHESAPLEHTATLMTKIFIIKNKNFNPWILCAKGQEPDNEFKRFKQPTKLIWEIVEETIKKI